MTTPVYIIGIKEGFKSKAAFDKFKQAVKQEHNINDLTSKYLLEGYTPVLLEKTNDLIKYEIMDKKKYELHVDLQKKEAQRQILKAKIKAMRNTRSNYEIKKMKTNDNIDNELLNEYLFLKKNTRGVPIPSPSEVLNDPDKYTNMIKTILSYRQTGKEMKYFKLLAEKLNISQDKSMDEKVLETVNTPNVDFSALKTERVIEEEDTDSDN